MSSHSTTANIVVDLHAAEERHATAVDAMHAQAVRRRELKPGHRWVIRGCPVCRGFHLQQVRGPA